MHVAADADAAAFQRQPEAGHVKVLRGHHGRLPAVLAHQSRRVARRGVRGPALIIFNNGAVRHAARLQVAGHSCGLVEPFLARRPADEYARRPVFPELFHSRVEPRLQARAGRAVRHDGVARHDDDVGGGVLVVESRQHQGGGGQEENSKSTQAQEYDFSHR
ncbi:hypothetical protein D3C72_1210810 [compost metagenome]